MNIYAFTLPYSLEHNGLIKVGQTEGDVAHRINDIVRTANLTYKIIDAWYDVNFTDKQIHRVLRNNFRGSGIKHKDSPDNESKNRVSYSEWTRCDIDQIKAAIAHLRSGKSINEPLNIERTKSFSMRAEQELAVEKAYGHFKNGGSRFLWNAKMRFGKTFSAYQLAKRLEAKKVIVITYVPSVMDSWRTDLMSHIDFKGWSFYTKDNDIDIKEVKGPFVYFLSFQDLLQKEDGELKERNQKLTEIDWDLVIIDEYHFGAWREKATDITSEQIFDEDGELNWDIKDTNQYTIDGKWKLYSSGTPFRALSNGEFMEDQIFSWSYIDEQKAKSEWTGDHNPYIALPKMEMYVYELDGDIIEKSGTSTDEFSLTEMFKTKDGKFMHETSVTHWLNMIYGKSNKSLGKTENARWPVRFDNPNGIHMVWFMDRVDSAKAMKDMLTNNVNFKDFKVVVIAGDEGGQSSQALDTVLETVETNDKTITITAGRLMIGSTVPQWTYFFMLRSLKAPEMYFQSIFRVQSPWVDGMNTVKDTCYVIDFDVNRSLELVSKFVTTMSEKDENVDYVKNIEQFLEFMPIYSYDSGKFSELDFNSIVEISSNEISSSMMSRAWSNPDLINRSVDTLRSIVKDQNVMDIIEKIELSKHDKKKKKYDISKNEDINRLKNKKAKNNDRDDEEKKGSKTKTDDVKKRLEELIKNIPIFLYITDYREKNMDDIIETSDKKLFKLSTGITSDEFKELVEASLFNKTAFNKLISMFRKCEESSLEYIQ